MLYNIKKVRTELGLTQMELARQSGLSLPTIQNIEAQKANPSFDVLSRLLYVLGLEIKISPPKFEIERAVLLGVPLSSQKNSGPIKPTKDLLIIEARRWAQYFKENTLSERESLAVLSLLSALRDHWPSIYREIGDAVFDELIDARTRDGHLIKLRRIAVSNLSRYL